MVGILQNYVGNHLLNHIYETTGKRVFHPFRKVLSIQLQPNGEYFIKVLKLDSTSDEAEIVYFKSKAILKNPGAYPFFPENFYTEMFPNLKSEQVILGDSFLRKENFIPICKKLKEL